MENRLYDNELEDLLKQQANQHRMYPSDHVWRKIHAEVHSPSRWPALSIVAFFIIASLVVGTLIIKPHHDVVVAATTTVIPTQNSSSTEEATTAEQVSNYAKHLQVNSFTQQTIASVTKNIETNGADELLILPSVTSTTIDKTAIVLNSEKVAPALHNVAAEKIEKDDDTDEKNLVVNTESFPDVRLLFSNNFAIPSANNNGFYFSNAAYNYETEFPFARRSNNTALDFDLTGGTTVYSSPLKQIGKKSSRLDFQVYITPSISYRRLVDDVQGSLSKSYITALPYAANYVVDLNNVIKHRPAVGYEIGFSLGYNLNKKLAIRSGFQFNTRQYNIAAYAHSSEPATVALSSDNSNLVLNTVSGFRSIQGSQPIELKNRYYEISVPVGIDWRPINRKFAWGISASVQPTYTFDKEPFIITSNYKNYADGSQLMRNWNINANFETYLGYNTGKYRWQIGPQFRYQVLATMANAFPIREYPLDFGIKLGLTRSLQ